MTLTTIIITLNEEKNIGRCLSSVIDFSDEILILDSLSTDKTSEIASQFGGKVKLFSRPFSGYGDSKNYLESLAKSAAIFSIDADEEVSTELKISIEAEKKLDFQFSAYSVKRKNSYCGKWIQHGGWNPDIKIRLWKKGVANWNLSEVHESVELKGISITKQLRGELLHYSFQKPGELIKKAESYSEKGASKLFRLKKKFSIFNLLLSPLARFFRDYFLKLGFLDGMAGFEIARITALEVFLKYKKLQLLENSAKKTG